MYKFISDGKPGDLCPKGERIRPWARNNFEGDQILIEKWNSVVGEKDKIYHLGDVSIPRKGLKVLEQLKGRKILVRGNHDPWKLPDLTKYFENILGSMKLDKYILTHYPIHHDSIPQWCVANLHGHTHSKRMLKPDLRIDERYLNLSVEQLPNVTPISFDTIRDGWKGISKDEYGVIS